METLNYNGEEPQWEKMFLLDDYTKGNANDDIGQEKVLRKEYEKLYKDRRDLANELDKAQKLL